MHSIPWLCVSALLLVAVSQSPKVPEGGPFGLSMITTSTGEKIPIKSFASTDECGFCHSRQLEEFAGSFHSVAHEDPLYRSFAKLALLEAGPGIYGWCSGCHSPAGVVAGLIPGGKDADLPAAAKAGVTCDVCHQISRLTGASGPWEEPGNASIVIEPGSVKRGPLGDIQENPNHTSVRSAYFASSEMCASCHTVIHPHSGLRLESTYEEWKSSIYAEKGVQCQDCHMRPVADAIQVAENLQPINRVGRASEEMSAKDREVHEHFFVGANSNTERLTRDAARAEQARQRLRSAARLSIEMQPAAPGASILAFEVVVENVGAGHALPTSLTELREMWITMRVTSADGKLVFESGALDEHGELSKGTVRFGSDLGDSEGKVTYKPWEAKTFLWKRVILPKGKQTERVQFDVPTGTVGPLRVDVQLRYRSASPRVLREVMKDEAFEPEIVEMATATAQVAWR